MGFLLWLTKITFINESWFKWKKRRIIRLEQTNEKDIISQREYAKKVMSG